MDGEHLRAARATGGSDKRRGASATQPEPVVHVCAGCGIGSPAIASNYTVITSRYGWRLTERVAESRSGRSGDRIIEWRCPECWARHTGCCDVAV